MCVFVCLCVGVCVCVCVCLPLSSDYACFQIELSKNYGQTEWREDIKGIMLKAGLTNQQITFLFVDTQVCVCCVLMCIHVCVCVCFFFVMQANNTD